MTLRIFRMAAAVTVLAVSLSACGGENRTEREQMPEVPLNTNLIENPSFEQWDGSVPSGWTIQQFEGTGTLANRYGKSVEIKRSGNSSFYLRGTFNVDRWMALTQRHAVPPGYRLWFAAEMQCTDLKKYRGQSTRAGVYVRFYDKDGNRVNDRFWADAYTNPLVGTRPWRKMGRRVDIPEEARTVEIGCICQMTGWLYCDDVELVLEAPVPWRKVETKYADFYYLNKHPFPTGAIDREAEFLEMVVEKLAIDPDPEDKISYYYYPSDEKFKEIRGFSIGRGHARMNPSAHELHTTSTYDDHQVIHLLLEPLGYPPFGLAEGIVFYVLGAWEGGLNIHMMVKELLLNQKLPALFRVVSQRDMDAVGMSVTVPGWSSFCMWIIDRYGIDKFKELYVETNGIEDAGAFNARFKAIYGENFDVMDREWRLWLLRYDPKI